MLIEGSYKASHIIRTWLEREYAFSFFWEDAEIRIGHHKGTWTIAKFVSGTYRGYFRLDDCFLYVEASH